MSYRIAELTPRLPPLVSEDSLIRIDEVVVSVELILPTEVRELSLALLIEVDVGTAFEMLPKNKDLI